MISLPIWAFILCLLGAIGAAGVVVWGATLIYIGRGMWG